MSRPQVNPAADPELRRTGLGGSDCAVVFGLNPYRTRLQLYLEKIGELPPADLSDNESVQWGVRLEDLVAQVYAERMGVKVRRNNRTLRHPTMPFLMAHLDREVVGQDTLLECKTAGEYMSSQWGAEMTAEVPQHYLMQCLHYMVVTGKSEAHLAALIGGNKHRIYVIKAADFQREMAAIPPTLERFWQRIQNREPPSVSNLDDVALAYPSDDGTTVQADQQVMTAVRELMGVRAQLKALGQREKDLKFEVASSMGAASTLVEGDQVVATYKGQSRETVDTKRLRAEYPAVAMEVTKTSISRTLVLKLKEDE